MLYVLTESTKLLWTPDSAHRETDVYAVDLCCCINPFCGCTTLDMTIRSQPHAETTYTFSVDVQERVLYEPENLSESDCAFANDFIRGCDDADWVRLGKLFGEQKRRVAETSDIQSFEPPWIPFQGIEFGDTMVAYSEVFPFAAVNQFVLGDVEYFIDDQYCLTPGCTCTKVAVTFFGMHDAKPVAADELYPMSRFDYHKKRWDHEIGIDASPHNCRQLTSAFQQSAPDLAALLKKRHALLKSAYALCKKNNAAGSNVLDKFNIPQISRDTGRNAPCPCGSGKKYKKCCGK